MQDLDLLIDLLKIKSISIGNSYIKELSQARDLITEFLNKLEFNTKFLGENNSVIYATRFLNKKFKTLLIYGHYDVQSVNDQKWDKKAFLPEIKKQRIYARGIADSKGQIFIHLKSIEELIRSNSLNKLNCIFLIEGEEEISSPTLKNLIASGEIKDPVDYILVSDSYMVKHNYPTILASFRGNLAFEVNVNSLSSDLHSGIFGGAVNNSAEDIMNLHNKVFTESFLKSFTKYSYIDKNPALLKACSLIDNLSFRKEVDKVNKIKSKNSSPSRNSSLLPALEITGLTSGYIGEGIQNIIPATANIKYNFRFPAGLKGADIWKIIKLRFSKLKKQYNFKLSAPRISEPFFMDPKSDYIKLAFKTAKTVYEVEPILKPEGGSISIVNLMDQYLSKDILLFGFADLDSNIHGSEENMGLENIEKGIKFSKDFIINLQQL